MSKTFTRKEFDELDEAIGKYRQRKDERQGRNSYYAYKKRKAERRKMREDARWITIGAMPGDGRNMPKTKGRHVLIDDEGEVISGAGGSLTGVKLEGAESTSGDVKVDPSKTSDPKPESPAGKEGKSSGEVAAEAKETETAKGEEKATGFDIETIKKAVESKDIDSYLDWLSEAPIGTMMDFNTLKVKKTGKDKWEGDFFDIYNTKDFAPFLYGYDIAAIDPETGEMTVLKGFEETKSETKTGSESEPKTEPEVEPKTDPTEESTEPVGPWEAKSYLDSYKDIGKTLEWIKSAPVGTAVLFEEDNLGFGDKFLVKKEADGKWKAYISLDEDAEPVNEYETEMQVATDLAHPDVEEDAYKISVFNPKTGEIEEKILGEAPEGESAGETKGESSDDAPPWAKEFGDMSGDESKLKAWTETVPEDAVLTLKGDDGEVIAKFHKDYDGWTMTDSDGKKDYLTDAGTLHWITKLKGSASWWEVTDPITDTAAKEKFSKTAEKGFADGPDGETEEPEGTKPTATKEAAEKPKKWAAADFDDAFADYSKTAEWLKKAPKEMSLSIYDNDGNRLCSMYKNKAGDFNIRGKEWDVLASDLDAEEVADWMKDNLKDAAKWESSGKGAKGNGVFKNTEWHGEKEEKSWEPTAVMADYTDLEKTREWTKSAPAGTMVHYNDAWGDFVIKKDADGKWRKYSSTKESAEPLEEFKSAKDVAWAMSHRVHTPEYIDVHDPKTGDVYRIKHKTGGYLKSKILVKHPGEEEFKMMPDAPVEKTPGTMSYATEDKASSGLTRVTYGSKAYSAAARKAAIQEAGDHAGKVKVHNKLFPGMQKWWSKLDDNQKTSLRDYTGSYHDTNEPLRGFTYTSFSKGDDHIKNKIKAIDEALDKSTLEEPLVVTRGVSLGTFNAMVKHKSSEYKTSKWDVPHYGEELVGKVLTEPSYMSCTAAGEADFSSKPVQLKIYCPAGTKGAYINPISAYGMHKPHPEDMDGSEDPTEGSEFEFLLQRGCKFKVRKITEGKSGQYEVELDLIEQNPRKLSVSGKKGIYDDGKDAYDF